jgi:hypothetical protein
VSVEELLARARRGIGKDIGYALGATPGLGAELPEDDNGNSDCSGFVAWCLGFKKFQPALGFLKRVNGGWLNTDGIFADLREPTGLFAPCEPREGAVIVYPSRVYALALNLVGAKQNPKIGHIGIVSRVAVNGRDVLKVIHCSSGNARLTGCSIAETDASVFRVGVVGFGLHASLEV